LGICPPNDFFYEPIVSLLGVGSSNAPGVYPPLPCELLALDSCLLHRIPIVIVRHVHLKGIIKGQ